MLEYNLLQQFRRLFIRTRYKRWLLPILFAFPYLFSYFWLLSRGQAWISNIMLTPLLMGVLLVVLTLALARCEFRR